MNSTAISINTFQPDYFFNVALNTLTLTLTIFLYDTVNARLRAINDAVQIWLLDNVTMTTI